MAAGVALLAASQWLHTPSVQYLVPFLVATAAALITGIRSRGTLRWWAVSCASLLVLAAGLAVAAQRDLWRVTHDWDGWRREAAIRGLGALGQGLDETLAWADAAAHDALQAPAERAEAFADLRARPMARDESGVVLFHSGSAFAWAGMIRPEPDLSRQGPTVIATPATVPFYLALQVVHRQGDRTAAAVALIDAVAPADRLSSPLARRIAAHAGLSGFLFSAPSTAATDPEVLRYTADGVPLFDVRAVPLVQGEVAQRISERVRARAGLAVLLALTCFVIGVWRGTHRLSRRAAALAAGLACTALVPLNQFSNLSRLFDPAVYFTLRGGPFTGNAGALAAASALALLGVLAVFRRQRHRVSRWRAFGVVMLVAGLGPFLLRDLARGIQIPPRGVDATLWLIWEVPLFLAAVSVLVAGTAAGATVLGPRRGVPPWVAPAAAAVAAVIAPVVWEAPGRWPWWYTFLWVGAIGVLAFSRKTRSVILSASTVAALGATTLVWGRTSRGRVDAAVRDLAGLNQVDSVAAGLLSRFGAGLAAAPAPASRPALLQHFVASDIASAGNPAALFVWPTDSGPVASFQTANIPTPMRTMAGLVARARQAGKAIVEPVATDASLELVMAVPALAGGVTSVVIAPRSRLFDMDPFARLIGLESDPEGEPPYVVRLRGPAPIGLANGPISWRRDGSTLHGDWVVRTGTGASRAHIEVELRPVNTLIQRGALIVLLNLAVVGLIWIASVVADGGGGRWFRARRRSWGRSYRARLSLALFAFFVLPATAFAIWSYEQLASDATQSRALLVRETLRALSEPPGPLWLPAESDRVDSPLFLYYGGELRETSDSLLGDIAPIGRFLDRDAELSLVLRGEATETRLEQVSGVPLLFGFRSFSDEGRPSIVIAAPARADELALGRRRRDLGVLVLFATALGALAALWLSGIAARQLARPIGTLRTAALSIAGGARTPPLEVEPTVEFSPVFTAFRRMAADLNASRTALEDAQRRTTAVLRNVASGVIAVDPEGRVSLANPSAEALLGGSLAPGAPFASRAPAAIAAVVERFIAADHDDEEFEIAVGQRQVRGTLTRLARGGGGAVITLDDVTELARAQRVLAWGEMARQVAHEIKNPLTPIRLGVQHLRRARADARVDFDRVLDQNVNQILAEIDRLDEIARAFSRYGAAPDERPRPSPVDVSAVVREVVALERMGGGAEGGGGPVWELHGAGTPVEALALGDELKEVLLNVLENARLADARRVRVSVERAGEAPRDRTVVIATRDDGHGIAPDVIPRIFEPHFSTRTSGSGLGLAISRQLVEGWGGSITVQSELGVGTTVEIRLRASS